MIVKVNPIRGTGGNASLSLSQGASQKNFLLNYYLECFS